MAENLMGGNLESEIAELSRQIEEKKRALESQSGIIRENKELLAESVAENFYPQAGRDETPIFSAQNSPSTSSGAAAVPPADYLDTLPPEKVETLNTYIAMIPQAGIRTTIKRVITEVPFIIDAFHDALVTRLYDELKDRGIIK